MDNNQDPNSPPTPVVPGPPATPGVPSTPAALPPVAPSAPVPDWNTPSPAPGVPQPVTEPTTPNPYQPFPSTPLTPQETPPITPVVPPPPPSAPDWNNPQIPAAPGAPDNNPFPPAQPDLGATSPPAQVAPEPPWQTNSSPYSQPGTPNDVPGPEPSPGGDPFNWTQQTQGAAPAAVPGVPGLDQNLSQPQPQLEPTEPAPTDLSQLTNLGTEQSTATYMPSVSTPETLVVPQQSTIPEQLAPETTTKKFPKALMIGAIVVLLLVIAGSAYFILGIGKSQAPAPASLPATQAPLTNPPAPVTQNQATPAPSPATPATGSATSSFGGGTSGTTGQSAIDILKARQATASASPSTTP